MNLYRLQWDRDGRADLYSSLPKGFEAICARARAVLETNPEFHSISLGVDGLRVFSTSRGDRWPSDGEPIDVMEHEYPPTLNGPDDPPDELFTTSDFSGSLQITRDGAFLTVEDDKDDWGASASVRIDPLPKTTPCGECGNHLTGGQAF